MIKKILCIVIFTTFSSFYTLADTTDQKWMKKVTDIHPGTLMALNNEKMPELVKK